MTASPGCLAASRAAVSGVIMRTVLITGTSAGFGLQRYLWPIEHAANLRLDFAWPVDNPKDDFTVYLWFTSLR